MVGNFILRRKIITAIFIISSWILAGVLVTFHEYLFLTNFPGVKDTAEMKDYSVFASLVAAMVWGFMGGTIFAVSELFFMQKRLQNKTFITVILTKSLLYSIVLVVINAFTSLLYNSIAYDLPIWSSDVIAISSKFIFSVSFWHPVTPFIIVLFVTLFIIQLNYKFGPGELFKYVRGTYFTPHQESRIFLFLDITSSTSIAEKLGHVNFFNLINQFYQDITDDIVASGGEIVDYVGDEIIICWKLERGLLNSNALKCVFEIEKTIDRKSQKYMSEYGLVPMFRSGFHLGEATVGEIGKVKKEITYFGDVMNTTARIQELCKTYEKKVVVSAAFLKALPMNNFKYEDLGEISLKGKSEKTHVFSVEE